MRLERKIFFLFISVVLFFFVSYVTVTAQNKIPVKSVSNGNTKASNTTHIMLGTIGQTSIGSVTNTNNLIQSGFWNTYYQDIVSDVKSEDILPSIFKLEQNYPNPFNPSTIIRFSVPERSNVLIKVYDVLGSEVATLVNKEMDAGWFQVEFNAAKYSSGVYIYRMQSGNFVSDKKLILIK